MREKMWSLFCLVMLIILTGCGGNNDPTTIVAPSSISTATSQSSVASAEAKQSASVPVSDSISVISQSIDLGSIEPYDFSDIFNVAGKVELVSGFSDEKKNEFIAAAKEQGFEVKIEPNGSTTIYNPEEKMTMIQKEDGTWIMSSEDGIEGQIGGSWPDHELARMIPNPGFTIGFAGLEENIFSVMFVEVTTEQMKDYVENLKKAGFDQNSEIEDDEVMGMVMYSYTAQNKEGYEVNAIVMAGVTGVSLTKP